MPNHARVFQGISKATQRKFYGTLLRDLKARGFEKVSVPFAGELTLAKCAILAGYRPENIRCSDINLYPSLLGYFYAGRPLSELGVSVGEAWADAYAQQPDDAHRVSLAGTSRRS